MKRGANIDTKFTRRAVLFSDNANSTAIDYVTIPRAVDIRGTTRDSDICIFTQLSIDRVDRLEELAASWKGSISVSLYVEDVPDIVVLRGMLRDIQHKMQRLSTGSLVVTAVLGPLFSADPNTACRGVLFVRRTKTTVLTRIAVPPQTYHPYDLLYPINVLRNLALKECDTDFVFSLDVDFTPSAGLAERLTDVATRKWMRTVSQVSVFLLSHNSLASKRSNLGSGK
ncbi:hypothetical protein HDU93_006657 [Gonapodya sp. JEL0774]|nr:hypothetical protein HDU93_006657 [Gonapodya sp. JEL0774]